jgi:predicted RNase H-like nuclease (RuvC/YqgF family)
MEMHNHSCPVCENLIKKRSIEFCPKCNWELIVISDKASIELKEYFENKIKLHKKSFSQTNKLIEEISSITESIETLEKEKNVLEAKINSLNFELSKNSAELQKMKLKADETLKNEKQISELQKQVTSLEVEIERNKKNKLFPPI